MKPLQFFRLSIGCALACGCLLLTACGGGDAPPAPPTVGAGGGSVAGPQGAQVFIPAGALAADTAIAVAQTSAGSPALPAGAGAAGTMFAFTPHGTSFASPVTITVPFDTASVPAGVSLILLKTNTQGGWEVVPNINISISGGLITAQVSSFSYAIVARLDVAAVTVTEPDSATFTVFAQGTPPFTYRWRKSDDNGQSWAWIAGASGSTYTTGPTTAAADHNDLYQAYVFGPDFPAGGDPLANPALPGWTASGHGRLMVTTNVVAPAITTQPADRSAAVGATAIFSCVASGTSVIYQWQRSNDSGTSWTNIAGATNASYTTPVLQASDNGAQLRCVASNTAGSTTSNAATLTMQAAPALDLTGTWVSNYSCTGTGGDFNGSDTLTVTQSGTSVSFTSQPDGGVFTGTLNGNVMTYSGGAPGRYSETGVWTLQDANRFTKTSTYARTDGSGGGSCPGTGQRQ